MRRLAAFAAVLAVAASAAGALSACGSETSQAEDGESSDPVYGVGDNRVGSVASLAQCRDWIEGTEEEKRATIDDIYNQLNQAGADGPTPDLPDDVAYELFERTCVQGYAAGFRLYKIYARSAAFSEIPGS